MVDQGFFTPVSGFDLPRFAGIPTFMRLPHVGLEDPRLAEVQIGLIGAPWDGGTTNRPGPRHGPRQLRDLSTMIRAQNGATWVAPFELARCADLGDVPPNPGDLMDSLARMEAFYDRVVAAGVLLRGVLGRMMAEPRHGLTVTPVVGMQQAVALGLACIALALGLLPLGPMSVLGIGRVP